MAHFNMVMESSSRSRFSVFHFPGPHSSQATAEGSFAFIRLPAALWLFHDTQGNHGSTLMPTMSRESLTNVPSTVCPDTYPQTFTLWGHASSSASNPGSVVHGLRDSHSSVFLNSPPSVLLVSCLEVEQWHVVGGCMLLSHSIWLKYLYLSEVLTIATRAFASVTNKEDCPPFLVEVGGLFPCLKPSLKQWT